MAKALGETFSIKDRKLRTQGIRFTVFMPNKPKYIEFFHNVIFVKCIRCNRKGCWWWYLMEHIHNNLMKLGGSRSTKNEKLVIKTRYISNC
jgi:hypothetical protein